MHCKSKAGVYMSIIIKNSEKFIIDRTLIEIAARKEKIEDYKVEKFLTLLKEIGADFIEINKTLLDKVKRLPENLDYIYSIEDISHIYFLDEYNYRFKYIAIDYEKVLNLDEELLNKMKHRKVILDINIQALDELFIKKDNRTFKSLHIDCIRIKNVMKYNLSGWSTLIEDINTNFSADTAFCASDRLYMANAVSLEACNYGITFVTAAFNGENYELTSLEELILSLKIIKKGITNGNFRSMMELKALYEELSGEKVRPMKPVIGEDIFKYESGIHADAIEKKSNTYEPYDPSDIGQKRRLYIGKHSGKKSIILRLKELNINCENIQEDELLKRVKEVSIKLRRNLWDKELIKVYNDVENTSNRKL